LVSQLPQSVADGTAQQARALADVREQMVRLAEAAARLETVGASVAAVEDLLQVPQLRGTLGEVWLEELLRQVFPEGLYQMQYAFRSGERVDAVLRVGPRLVPIDAKFPLDACRRMLAADGEAVLRERRAFRRSLRDRVDEIADKYIRPAEGTFEFALMYIPAENVYYEAVVRGEQVQQDESIVGYALARRVIPVSPNTLYAYLAAVLHGLRGLEVEERAREILAALGEVEQEVGRIERAVEIGGKHFENASRQFEDAGHHLGRLRGQLRALRWLGRGGSEGGDGTDGGEG
jgi:DNA recombination protein RmuC